MSDRKRQLRKLLDRYRDRAAAISLELPELKALAARHDLGEPAVVERPAPAAVRAPAPAPEPAPKPSSEPAPEPVYAAPAARRRPPVEADEDPASSRGYSGAVWLGVVVAAVVAGGWLANSRLQRKNAHRAVPLALSNPVGLAQRGGILYTFDRSRAQLGSIDAAAAGLIALKSFPNGSASGLAASSDKLWSADANGVVYEHGVDDYAVRRTFANPHRRPSALHWDGSHLWIADARTNSLYEYKVGSSLVPARQFTLPPGMTPVGLHVENGLVWVLDAAGRSVHRFRVRALLEPVDTLTLQPWISAPGRPSGMIVDGGVLWITADGPAQLHRFDLRLLAWRSDS